MGSTWAVGKWMRKWRQTHGPLLDVLRVRGSMYKISCALKYFMLQYELWMYMCKLLELAGT